MDDALVFVDDGISGAEFKRRPGLARMLNAAEAKAFDVLVISEPSRLGREQAETNYVLKRIGDAGVRVFYYLEDREAKLDSAVGKFIEAVHACGSELERERIRQRTMDGMLKRAQAGYSTGGAVYGYRSSPVYSGRKDSYGQSIPDYVDRKVEPNEARAVLGIYKMYQAGYGLTAIAKCMNGAPRRVRELAEFFGGIRPPFPRHGSGSWAGMAVREILRNDVYRGARAYGRIQKVWTAHGTRSKRAKPSQTWTVKEGSHPAIISPELWERVRRRREAVAQIYRQSGMAQTQLAHSRFLLTGILHCAACGGHFIARAGYLAKAGRSHHYGCGRHARRGSTVCPNRTCLPQAAIEQELLVILLGTVLTPANQERLLHVVNARLRAQATAARPRLTEIRRALMQVEREIANYTRAIGRGDFTSLEEALGAAEGRRTALKAELATVEGSQPAAVMQLTPAARERHLQGITEKLRSGVNGKVREAIQQSVARILVGVDGSLTIEAKPGGLLGMEGIDARLDGEKEGDIIQQTHPSSSGRRWRVATASM